METDDLDFDVAQLENDAAKDKGYSEQWPARLKACFNRYIPEFEFVHWREHISYLCGRKTTDGEIIESIEMASNEKWSGKHTNRSPITADTVAGWIRRYRAMVLAAKERDRRSDRLEQQKERIRLCGDDTIGIWDIICEPDDVHDCQALERYTRMVIPGWKRPAEEIQRRYSELASDMKAFDNSALKAPTLPRPVSPRVGDG